MQIKILERRMGAKSNKRCLGSLGEQAAVDFLKENGFIILARNYRVGRLGEIDIISLESEYICFIEVKTRTGMAFGLPCEAVNKKKQQNIMRLAQIYINDKKLINKPVRFDIVEVIADASNQNISIKKINIIKNAF
jgi:putative endonuclease